MTFPLTLTSDTALALDMQDFETCYGAQLASCGLANLRHAMDVARRDAGVHALVAAFAHWCDDREYDMRAAFAAALGRKPTMLRLHVCETTQEYYLTRA